ncbi:uncharacterized protein LOC141656296 [Silene latifolia]|uniref:uncharacterized protein LOC141656296 n=1 Tax=Silene latifolia TaxID=37657 RepID=UPI003D78B2CE
MNPTLNTCDTTMPTVHIEATELSDRVPDRLEFPATTMDSGLTNSSFSMLMSQEMLTPHKQQGELESVYADLGEDKMCISNKRKATTEVRAYNPSLPNMSISNKRVAVSGISPRSHGVSQLTTRSKRAEAQSESPKTATPVLTKTRSAVSRNRVKQPDAPSGIAAEKIDPVRAKFRESLTAALALVSQEKTSSVDADKTEDTGHTADVQSLKGESKLETSVSSNTCPSNEVSTVKNDFPEIHSNDVSGEPWKFTEQDFQSNSIFPGEDTPFGESLFLKDELLQGNGLSWALDFDAQIAEMRAVESSRRDELANEAVTVEKVQEDMSPESVALRIESELFTLFGSVNKKYKEKGRSLLFNLKDRNNPELRERVMSGEISAERLCSMTAEELASKELSQWRMAKAEELDQMKVLPDSETNVRRLVKKTHKGEYQVDFDQDDSVVEDIPTNISIVRENRKRKTNSSGAEHRSSSDGAREHRDAQCTITIPGDGTDMLGLMVDDMRDLPPILSLDEFMDSLDKEPPFENLPRDSERTPELDKNIADDGVESADDGTESKSPVLPSKDPDVSTSEKGEKAEEERVQPKGHVNRAENQRALEATNTAEQVKVEYLWQGLLQLTLSSTAYVVASYKSGEKATTRQWPSSFEIKGRVRLDAFDKFLQELPKSRTRSTMVVHFALAKRCTEEERCNLIDLIDSYVTDQRLGYAEPTPGVELYICPPRSKTVDMIINHLPKSYTENLTDIDNGLIGILVWRKERIPSTTLPGTLPNPEKHSTITKPPAERDLKPKENFPSKAVPKGNDDDGEDVPPGFGPTGGNRDDDDLPEFNFSAGPNLSRFSTTKLQSPPPRVPLAPDGAAAKQVEQMRALIQKYGKSEDTTAVNGIPVRPWNDDDDDDIPEWQPQDQAAHHYRQPNPLTGLPAQKDTLTAHLPVRPSFQQPMAPLAKPMLPVVQPNIRSQGTWRHPGPNTARPTGNRGGRGQPREDRFYRGRQNRDRRSSAPYNRNRGH